MSGRSSRIFVGEVKQGNSQEGGVGIDRLPRPRPSSERTCKQLLQSLADKCIYVTNRR